MKKKIDGGAETASSVSASASAAAATPQKTRGRPLSFDRDKALDAAMHVFWEHGYEAASISDLTSAMGITPPSLYTAFGDKAKLFLEAIERYGKGPGGFGRRVLAEEASAHAAIKRLLEHAAEELTSNCHPLGCMLVMAATNCSVAAEHIQAALARRRALSEGLLKDRFQVGVNEGELPADTDVEALASFYTTVYQGMSMQAKDGATRKSLLATAAAAMRAWPVPVSTTNLQAPATVPTPMPVPPSKMARRKAPVAT